MRSFAIIPAAGQSQRMGQPKLLMPWGNTTVIGQVLASWAASRVSEVVIVLRRDDDRLAAECRDRAHVVTPSLPPPDMKASVLFGLGHVRENCRPDAADVWLLAPADMPWISARVIDQLLEQHDPRAARIIAPTYEGRCGHPVLFPWPLADEVAQLGDEEGINALAERHGVRKFACPDPGILEDVDTPKDYLRLQKRHKTN